MKYGMKNIVLPLAVLALFGLFAAGCSDTDSDTSDMQSKPADFQGSATELCRIYKENEVAADQKLKGKIVLITGKVTSISKTLGDIHVMLDGGSDGNVDCLFTPSEESAIARLVNGQDITVKGQVDGKVILSVVLRKCRLQ